MAGGSSLAASATSSPIPRSVKTPGIELHGGHIASVTAWAGLVAFWKGQSGAKLKGMHWRTYERLCDEHDTFEHAVNLSFIARFGPILKKGGF